MFREPQLARPIWIPVQGQERLQNHLETMQYSPDQKRRQKISQTTTPANVVFG